ncbi:two-component sensor histidine kinase [Imbroritus primus]|jgi:two-component system CAI-1 autoinducer sensor kinase/phosphatase CqsS|uniref:Two-component sensor histidine kinase n=1 Tax=Imbroritus primus TaxID=3058603 RepID=A0ACD3STG6_9BURK|nr:two-component sensor histidine kinase [Burkholderiaceae bacterium PBA]
MLPSLLLKFRRTSRILLTRAHDIVPPGYEKQIRLHRLLIIGLVALIGFPSYYIIWRYIFPQPYENLELRVLGMVLFLPLLFIRYFRPSRWFVWYFHFVLTYALPFFFTFMLLMNGGSAVWGQSLLIAVFALYYFDDRIATASLVIGALAAFALYFIIGGPPITSTSPVLAYIPIAGFAIVIIYAGKIDREILTQEKLDGMATALSSVAHELRTPLLSVSGSVRGLEKFLPTLVRVYEKNPPEAMEDYIPASRLGHMNTLAQRIDFDVRRMNTTIELLLTSAHRPNPGGDAMTFDIDAAVTEAIQRYPFMDGQENLVHFTPGAGHIAHGNRELFTLVVTNLLKNALRAIKSVRKGEIEITVQPRKRGTVMVFRDTGPGIAKAQLPHIFRRFYSYPESSSTGIGLAFCREVLSTWDATIQCRSVVGEFTEFTIAFPPVSSPSGSPATSSDNSGASLSKADQGKAEA